VKHSIVTRIGLTIAASLGLQKLQKLQKLQAAAPEEI
jgi:hypothetical protein